MWPWPLLTFMASLPEHGTCDRGPPCTTHNTSKYANSHVMHCACTLASVWMADHSGPDTSSTPSTRHPPPPVAVLVVPVLQKAVDAFRNVTREHSQPKWLNLLQHGIYIMLKA